ncbi:MAG: hypothetical protein V3R65_08195 [Acidiferrobacterales bacterium]
MSKFDSRWERYARLLDGPHKFADYDCERNTISVEELFERYNELGFLYPAKQLELDQIWDKVRHNWAQAYKLGGDILRVYTYRSPNGEFATTTLWRSGQDGWTAEHLVANDPVAAMIMTLGVSCDGISDGIKYVESWYRPTNPYPNRLYSRAARYIGSSHSSIRVYNYLAVNPNNLKKHLTTKFISEEVTTGSPELFELACETRGHIYATGEGLANSDISLSALHKLFQTVGLTRQRKVVLLYRPVEDVPVGAAIAYRGPLGFNLSLIENRCDILLGHGLTNDEILPAIATLVDGVRDRYEGFPPGYIPVIGDNKVQDAVLSASAGRVLRRYAHFGVTQDGFAKWYDSVVSIVGRVVRHRAKKEARNQVT